MLPSQRRFQDGAATANNPAVLALQQARLLWPDTQIECLVSVGSGTVPVHKREKSMSAYVDTGNVLIESACSVDKVASALAATAPMIPGLTYCRQASLANVLGSMFELPPLARHLSLTSHPQAGLRF